MVSVLNHPELIYEWFTTVLLSFHGEYGLVIYQKWALGGGGFAELTAEQLRPDKMRGATLLLDAYYLMYLCAFVNTLFIFRRWRKDGWLKIRPHVGYDALIFAIIGTLVGAKLAYIFIYNPDFYFKDPADTGQMLHRIFLNWSGMASHGAAFGIVAAMFLYWLIAKAPMLHIGDAGCTAGAAGAMFIRTANFLNGELYGREDTFGLPWAMRFEVRNSHGNQLFLRGGKWFEQASLPGGGSEMRLADEPYRLGHEFMHKAADGTREFFAPGSVPADLAGEYLRVVTSPRHPSQLYQFILEGLLLFLFMVFMRKRVTRVGQLCGIFFIGYPLARILGEFFRQPDVQFASADNPLGTVAAFFSMGQILSLGMMLFGITLLVVCSRKGKLISELQMWPAEKTTKPVSSTGISLSGETSAGDLAGVTHSEDGTLTSRIQRRLEGMKEERNDEHEDD